MKDKILGVLERILWGMVGAVIVLILYQKSWELWLKVTLAALCLVGISLCSLLTNLLGKDKIEDYSNVASARKDIVPKPMESENARIVRKKETRQEAGGKDGQNKEADGREKRRIQSIVLINEEGTALTEWSMVGKSAMVIGKGTEKEAVDIDLSGSAFAQMISKQHAVLNYTENGWCIDDIDSKNGTRVKKINRNAILDLKLVGTVELGVGDIIYIANTMLQLR